MENNKTYKPYKKKATAAKVEYKSKRGNNDGSGFTVHGE